MPDIWTKHPEIVRDLVKEAGFRCGVEGRFLKGRDPGWTCIFDGPNIRGDLYIHHISQLRSELTPDAMQVSPAAMLGGIDGWGMLALGLALGAAATLGFRRRAGRRSGNQLGRPSDR
jgi:hypothetical protein